MSARSAVRHAVTLLSAGLATLALLSCGGGGDPAVPLHDTIVDTYVLATVTVLDGGTPCTPLSCDPEFYDCATLAPVAAGTTYELRADTATAGMILVTNPANFTVTGTDTGSRFGIALELQLTSFTAGSATATFGGNLEHTYVDVDTECGTLFGGIPTSRFVMFTPGAVVLTAAPVDGSAVVPAVADGSGGYSPASIVEGTFSFVGRLFQPTPTGSIVALVHVDGCFRVNLPAPERGVPVTPNPPSSPCP